MDDRYKVYTHEKIVELNTKIEELEKENDRLRSLIKHTIDRAEYLNFGDGYWGWLRCVSKAMGVSIE